MTTLTLGDIDVEVVFKDIKNIHLSVYPPVGRVRVSAPLRMKLDTLRVFVISKLDWIKKERKKLRSQERETSREYLNRESHFLWGTRYLMKVIDGAPARVELKPRSLILYVHQDAAFEKKHAIMEGWYREQLREALPGLLARWEPLIGVKAKRCFVQHMKTKWGSCNAAKGSVRLNTELAKKPPACLEYILVHELIHLREPTHNARFISLMDRFMPDWQRRREQLNQLPVRHEDWEY